MSIQWCDEFHYILVWEDSSVNGADILETVIDPFGGVAEENSFVCGIDN